MIGNSHIPVRAEWIKRTSGNWRMNGGDKQQEERGLIGEQAMKYNMALNVISLYALTCLNYL